MPHPLNATRALALALAAASLVALMGQALVVAPIPTIGLVGVCALLAVATAAPRAALAFGLGTYALSLEQRLGFAYPEATKGLIILLAAPLVIRRGIDVTRIAPIIAYAVVMALTFTVSTRITGLSPVQTISSFITLTLGWSLLAVRYTRGDVRVLLGVICWTPLISVALGVLLYPLIGGPLPQSYAGPPRLAGATIAPFLAMLGLVGVTAAALYQRLYDSPRMGILCAINAGIVIFTLTRGAIFATLVVLIPVIYRALRNHTGTQPHVWGLRIIAMLFVAIALAGTAIPLISSRNETSARSINEADATFNTSGRLDAWGEFYALAKVNPLFGRGLGAGPIAKIETEGFRAQHNEYVRMLLEGGWIGLILLLAAIVTTIVLAIKRSPSLARPDLVALFVAFLMFSATDNTLTTPTFAAGFCLIFGLMASYGSSEPAS